MLVDEIEKGVTLLDRVSQKLKPPPPDADASETMAWRWFIVAILGGDTLILLFHIILACGLTPVFSGFALASDIKTQQVKYVSDLKAQQDSLQQMRTEMLESRIFDLRVEQCRALAKSESASVFTVQLDEVKRQYRTLTSHFAQTPDCKEL